MIRGSLIILALATVFAMNGCSQCSNPNNETAPATEAVPEAAPADSGMADPAAPADGTVAPADGAAAPADGAAPAATPAH